jgi:hypothetical protein
MRKYTIIFILVLMLLGQMVTEAKKKQEILFPKREYVKKQSLLFFKQVNLNHPFISKVEFFARSNAYLSAYIAFSPFVAKSIYFKKILPPFVQKNKTLIDKFEQLKKKLTIETHTYDMKNFQAGKLTYYLLILHTLVQDNSENKLSGDMAFRLWNILLRLTKVTFKEKENSIENAALLSVASHLNFFKKSKKWLKKAKKILKKQKPGNTVPQEMLSIF